MSLRGVQYYIGSIPQCNPWSYRERIPKSGLSSTLIESLPCYYARKKVVRADRYRTKKCLLDF